MKPAQSYCRRCGDLFVYFQLRPQNHRRFCLRCVEIKQRQHNAQSNEFYRIWRRVDRIKKEAVA